MVQSEELCRMTESKLLKLEHRNPRPVPEILKTQDHLFCQTLEGGDPCNRVPGRSSRLTKIYLHLPHLVMIL